MTLPITWNDVLALGPIAVVFGGALLLVVLESILRKASSLMPWVTAAALVIAGGCALSTVGVKGMAFGGTVITGGYASYFAFVFSAGALLVTMLSHAYLPKRGTVLTEYYILLLAAVTGMMVMAASNDLVVFFLGLETMSVAFYVLAGFTRTSKTSNESAMKYFLLGAFATGFLLYGMALVYGTLASTNIAVLRASAAAHAHEPLFVVGLGLLLIGFVFKVAAVPFHMWVPDVYEGAPTMVSGLMSTGGKSAAFAAFLLVFAPDVLWQVGPLREAMAVLAALSMIVGNIIAITQTSVKRMLAYSSVAHAGYILTGVIAANAAGSNGVLFYLLAYTLMNVGAFGVLSILETATLDNVQVGDLSGLSRTRPWLAGLMALFMFSLTGIPPFAGFFGKYYVFTGAIAAGYTWLAIVGVLMSVVSAYYYLRLVVVMYFQDGSSDQTDTATGLGLASLVMAAIAVLVLGLLPSTIVNLTSLCF
jgi:NADH-quinone oxidoreductase subunit N